MSLWAAIVLGIVQGASEFFPVSSSAHLEITRALFGWQQFSNEVESSFDVAVHLGTLLGAVVYLRGDILRYGLAALAPLRFAPLNQDGRIGWFLLVSALPAGLVGVLLADAINNADSLAIIALALIVFGLVLAFADRFPARRGAGDFSLRDALLMGVGQALALQPGVSRAGVTLSVARLLGFERDGAARLVFLMSLPVIAGAGLFSFLNTDIPSSLMPAFWCGVTAAALTGFVALWGTLRLVRSHSFVPFVWYRVLLGSVILLFWASGWL